MGWSRVHPTLCQLKLLEPKTFRHQGALSSEVLKNLASGVLQVLT